MRKPLSHFSKEDKQMAFPIWLLSQRIKPTFPGIPQVDRDPAAAPSLLSKMRAWGVGPSSPPGFRGSIILP